MNEGLKRNQAPNEQNAKFFNGNKNECFGKRLDFVFGKLPN